MCRKAEPDLRKLHPFGCLAFAHIPKEKRQTKFQSRSIRCVFLGHTTKQSAYILKPIGDSDYRKVIVARNVHFLEDIFPTKRPM